MTSFYNIWWFVWVFQEVDRAVIPTVIKASLRDGIGKVQRRILDAAKAAAGANKDEAVKAAKKAAAEAVAAGKTFLVLQLDVGLDNKAAQEAYKVVQKEHPTLPALFVSSDPAGMLLTCLCCLVWHC